MNTHAPRWLHLTREMLAAFHPQIDNECAKRRTKTVSFIVKESLFGRVAIWVLEINEL